MLGLENKDSSFFTIESPDTDLVEEDFNKNLISLNITEKMGAMTQGTLQFYDPRHYFSRVLRTGVRLIITWGYRNRNTNPDSVIAESLNFDEVTGQIVRRGYQGFISSPTGEGGSNGVVKYNCNFTAFDFRGEEKAEVYSNMTKRSIIDQAFTDLGISLTKRIIDFTLGNDSVSFGMSVRQEESTFAFLNRKAAEWGAFFHVTFSPSGEPVGFFIDTNKIGTIPLPAWALEAGGTSNAIGYKGKLNNVKSYKWSSSESESGVGDNVRLDIPNGQIMFRRYVAETEKVITWKLNIEKVQKEFANVGANDIYQAATIMRELVSTKPFEEIKHFFTPVEQTTAPNGYGYRINCDMIGNPLYIPGNLIEIIDGFPDRLGGSQSKWYLHSVNHRIDRSGYNMSIEVADVFYLSPIGELIR